MQDNVRFYPTFPYYNNLHYEMLHIIYKTLTISENDTYMFRTLVRTESWE
jgi:hypothetical protein